MSQVSIKSTKPRGTLIRQHAVLLQNRAGSLSSLVNLLATNGIHVIGISIQDSRDATIARLVLDHPNRAEELFFEKGIPFTASELVVAKLRHAAEDLQKCLNTLLETETNLDFAYALTTQHQGHTLLAMHLEDVHFTAQVLHHAGITLYYEEDLLR